jgi:tRNA 2-selenouridine synthase
VPSWLDAHRGHERPLNIRSLVRPLNIADFLALDAPVVDVRSPGEFQRGHLPGARSLPLFSDEERAVVGTLYKQSGRDEAVLEGLRIVGPKLAGIVEAAKAIAPNGRIRVHCWRGGERSGSVAWLLDKAGFVEVNTLRGGYKSFRNHVLGSFDAAIDLRVLGGYTGTGKTETLRLLADRGAQVIDLEALASHKGSAFGAIGEAPQPTTEQFENLLWNTMRKLDLQQTIWVEDESVMIGRVKLPDPFFERLRSTTLYFAEMSLEERAARLVADYGSYPKEELADAVHRIEKRLGPQHCKMALEALVMNDLFTVARITLQYYDKAYARGAALREPSRGREGTSLRN